MTQHKLIFVLGELISGPSRSMNLNVSEYALYGVGDLCEWLWTNRGEPCTLMLTVSGGDVEAEHALLAAMRYHGECHTYGVGYIGSAGVDILHAGKTRGIHPDAYMMTHRGSKISNKKQRDLYEARDRKLYADCPEILAKWHLVFPARDRIWTSEEAVAQGFVDYIAEAPHF